MRVNSSMIKKLRKDSELTQEQLAEKLHMSPRHLARIESGETEMDIWQYMSMLELLGHPSENFWLLYLDTKEYDNYRLYRKLKRLLAERRKSEANEIVLEIEKGSLVKQPFIKQFIAYAKVIIDEDMLHEQAIENLHNALEMSIKKFDETKIDKYRLTYNEIYIIALIASKLFSAGEQERAIALMQSLIENRENVRANEEDKAYLFPWMAFILSNFLGKAKKYKECLKICNIGIEVSREYRRFWWTPSLIYNMAASYDLLGEEEHIWKTHLIRAYHCAYAMGRNELAQMIKKDAEKKGVTV